MSAITLTCPIHFTLYEHDIFREDSLRFINSLEEAFIKCSDITIDLSQTQNAYAESTLVLFAQIHSMRCRNQQKKKAVAIQIIYPEPTNKDGYAQFISTGLHKALDAKNEQEIVSLTNQHNFYQSGNSDRFDQMILSNWHSISNEEINLEQKFLLHQGVSEAILNVKNHAYIHKQTLRNRIGKGRWWQCSWYQQSKKMFVFLIYDMGSGILGTYQNDELTETERLKEAMKEGYSRYCNRKRGKGSENIKQVIHRTVEKENLTVYTDRLIYQYLFENGVMSDVCITSKTNTPLRGTLVAWTLILGEV